jgi:hypothetical protein
MERASAISELVISTVKQTVLLDYYGSCDFESVRSASEAAARRLRAIAGDSPADLMPELDALAETFEALKARCEWAVFAHVPVAANWPHDHPNWTRH